MSVPRDRSERYEILGEIGRGGIGIVYKGRDQDLGRDVALKMLKDEHASRPDVLARFVEEAQIGGQLQHPGIVPVYELGLQSGERPYLAMKLVKGETLAAQLARRSDAIEERRRLLGVFEQVCQTMAYAHSRHVVHRDLKPANVMIGAFGEVQVVDWGLAKVLQREPAETAKPVTQFSVIETVRSQADSGSHSIAGSTMGTPAYMPPEQALGDVARVDERSDVFALGAILCEILTGDAPYRSADGDLVRQAANAELAGAHERLKKCGADEALVALTKECLAPSQGARPASAAEVAERVSAYLTSVEERARQAEVRAAEARLKNRVTLIAAAAGLVVLSLGVGGWMWLDSQARARRDAATERVASAMSAASGARGRAQSAGFDVSLWSTAVASAEQLASLAGSDEVDADARRGAETLLVEVRAEAGAAQAESDRRARDAAMLARLEAARIPADEDVRKNALSEQRRLDAAYAQAFTEYLGGQSPLEKSSEETLASLRRGDIEVELAGSLDHWGLVRDALRAPGDAPDVAGTARLREIATLLDAGDAWRAELRSLLPNAAEESARLRDLAERADFAAQTAVGCRVLSQALWRAGEKEAAVTVLRRGQELHPSDFDLCFHLALQLELLDEPRPLEAIEIYRIAHSIRPEQNEVLHRQMLALSGLRRYADEERIARLLVARHPLVAHWLNHVGNALYGQRRVDEAIASYRRALELDPKDVLVLGDLGNALADRGQLDEAIASYRRALELKPGSALLLTNLGVTLAGQGKIDEAIACYRQAIDRDPKDALAHLNLGNVLFGQGQLEEAIASYRRAIDRDPKEALAWSNLGVVLTEQGKPDEAIASLRRATELDPENANYHANLGTGLDRQGRLGEASASHRRSIELDPTNARVHYNLGVNLDERGELEGAIAAFRRAIELDPRVAALHNALGMALSSLGSTDEAIASYRRALEIEPENAPALINLGARFQESSRFDEALEAYRRAEENFAKDPSPFGRQWRGTAANRLGNVLESMGRYEEALRAQRHAETLQAGDYSDAKRAIARLEHADTAARILDGSQVAASPTEWEWAIKLGFDRRRDREVVALTEATLRTAPDRIDYDSDATWGTYLSAISALRLTAGASEEEQRRLRDSARAWLDLVVAHFTSQRGSVAPKALRQKLRRVLTDASFTSVRGEEIEGKGLPEAERPEWRAFWQRVAEEAAK